MDVTATLTTERAPEALFAVVGDLGTYPLWLDIVPHAHASAFDDSWSVQLRGRLGPFARSKRLRMVRTTYDAPRLVVFERQERDGRDHAPWVLTAAVAASPPGSALTMRLHYGGGLFGPVVERLLREEIERSKPKLLALLDQS
ncbi:MAG: SRPBCC family protein [Acidimicrobiales bacterium]